MRTKQMNLLQHHQHKFAASVARICAPALFILVIVFHGAPLIADNIPAAQPSAGAKGAAQAGQGTIEENLAEMAGQFADFFFGGGDRQPLPDLDSVTRDYWNFLPDFVPGESVYENAPAEELPDAFSESDALDSAFDAPGASIDAAGIEHGSPVSGDALPAAPDCDLPH